MGGVDHSDQLRSYYSCCRSFHKWYKYLFWFIFDVSNTFILHKENVAVRRPGRRPLLAFRRAVGKQGIPVVLSIESAHKKQLHLV